MNTSALPPRHAELLDGEFARLWRLGRNAIVGWSMASDGVDVLAVPQYLLPRLFSNHEKILSGPRRMAPSALAQASEICEIAPYRIASALPSLLPDGAEAEIESLIRRYAVSRITDKAVVLFDIVGFSLYTPLEQLSALNSLSYSMNVAYLRARELGLGIRLSHSPTGDGFYLWNRDQGPDANVDLFCLMMLTLADNALGRDRSNAFPVPVLRACFHVGSCYEYFQPHGEDNDISHFIVGDVTIALARMVGGALPGQILLGNFLTGRSPDDGGSTLNTAQFVLKVQDRLSAFSNVRLSRDVVRSIICYLTGPVVGDGNYSISRYLLTDKHGFLHEVYNAKINLHRNFGIPVFLGLRYGALTDFKGTEAGATGADASLNDAQTGWSDPRPDGKKRILFVEDDPDIRSLMAGVLRDEGYEVVEAEDGPGGLNAFESHGPFSLVFTDVIMPGVMTGPQLARSLRQRQADIRILFTSGYAEDVVLKDVRGWDKVEWLAKPYSPDELIQRIELIMS